MRQTNMQQDTSMLYWFPKIADILPVPKTEILALKDEEVYELIGLLDGNVISEELFAKIKSGAAKIGYPLFLRSDMGSAKHDYEHSCHLEKEEAFLGNLASLIEWHLMVDLWPQAIVFRELLSLYSDFKAFRGKLPIAKERRYFVDDGVVMCHHPYWPEGAIEQPLHEDWITLLQDMNLESAEEISELTGIAEIFSAKVPGFFSVDFAMTDDGTWYLIDAARGELSWHPEHKEES